MATERTMMHPFGGVIHFEVADETYMHPFAGVVEGDITAVAAGPEFDLNRRRFQGTRPRYENLLYN